MKNIKQVVYATVAGAFAAAPLMVGAAAATTLPTSGNSGAGVATTSAAAVGITNTTVFALISNVMNWLLGLTGVLAVIGFVISGILYLTAAGDEEQIEKAKTVMMYAIIGLVVALVGLIIVNAVFGLTGGGAVTTF